ncbi:glycosyltransferase family 4 protein [Flagellimonas hadalis]|uniref:Glycosyltransferase family 4 protein n=2 Tax=Flavobacteriaceae TaxID=49546 RepID=A0A5N5J6A1_9FLAO|nr:glycosyltransferase family 4 protein [Allomuricauda hadalis]
MVFNLNLLSFMPKKILIICSYANSLIHFRGDFIADLLKNGFMVYGAAPDMSQEIHSKLTEMGAIPLEYQLQRTGMNPFNDLKSILELKKIIKAHDIDLVFPYTIKPVIYGSIAANMSKIPAVSLITGLGFTFTGTSKKARTLQKITELLYKVSIRKNKLVIFQNRDDHKLFLERNIIKEDNKVDFVSGSGVNLNSYPTRVNNKTTDKIIFILVARLIREKGIHLFIEAASLLKKEFPNAEFHVIGKPDQSPSAIHLEQLHKLNEQGTIVYHGRQKNVAEFLFNSDIFVLPTFYREGVPRSILEALSVGMPIITTDSPGCRETVVKGENGILVAPQDLDSLVEAMRFFLENPKQIEIKGSKSRELAEQKFDVKIINAKLISLLSEELK